MNTVVIAVVVLGVLGAVFGLILAFAAKIFHVEKDPREEAIAECLPGANCGGCGYPGCDGYAAAMVEDAETPLTLCAPGGAAAAQAVAVVLGRSAGEMVQKAAVVACRGDCNATKNKMEYAGIESCAAAKLMFGGAGSCTFGCMGLGDCAAACPSDAICIENGIAHVDTRVCTGCGACMNACPNGVIKVLPVSAGATVICSSHDKGAAVRKKCSAGCIGCGLCMKNCPSEAIKLENNLAVIDPDKCTGCGACKEKCPVKCIS